MTLSWKATETPVPVSITLECELLTRTFVAGAMRETHPATPADILAAAAANPDLREALLQWALNEPEANPDVVGLRATLTAAEERVAELTATVTEWTTGKRQAFFVPSLGAHYSAAQLIADLEAMNAGTMIDRVQRAEAETARMRKVVETAQPVMLEAERWRALMDAGASGDLIWKAKDCLLAAVRAHGLAAVEPAPPPAEGTTPQPHACIGRGSRADCPGCRQADAHYAALATVSDPVPTGSPARDAQLHGGACWLIEQRGPGAPTWLDRGSWGRNELVHWAVDATAALAFPTQAEATMFAREYLPELEGKVEVTEHEFTSGKKGEAASDEKPAKSGAPNEGSPLPWRVGYSIKHEEPTDVRDADGDVVARCLLLGDSEFIVSRCNTQPDPGAVRRETARAILAKFALCDRDGCKALARVCDRPVERVACLEHGQHDDDDVPWLLALEAAEAAAGGERG